MTVDSLHEKAALHFRGGFYKREDIECEGLVLATSLLCLQLVLHAVQEAVAVSFVPLPIKAIHYFFCCFVGHNRTPFLRCPCIIKLMPKKEM